VRVNLVLAAGVLLGGLVAALPASAEMSPLMRLASLDASNVTTAGEQKGESVVARIDLSDQKMYVYVGETLTNTFPVSTGKPGYGTPAGRYSALWTAAFWRSKKYNNAPMPWAVFFHGGYAVHGTTDVRRLGRPASHGCVRLLPANAKIFYSLVRKAGLDNTLITIVR